MKTNKNFSAAERESIAKALVGRDIVISPIDANGWAWLMTVGNAECMVDGENNCGIRVDEKLGYRSYFLHMHEWKKILEGGFIEEGGVKIRLQLKDWEISNLQILGRVR